MSQNEESKASTSQGVYAEVADALKSSPALVRSKLVVALTERELNKRVEMLDKALVKGKELEKEVLKIRPEDSYDAQGNKVPGNFTKAQFETLKKAKEKSDKFNAALEKAFAGDFEKLSGLMSGKESSDSSASE